MSLLYGLLGLLNYAPMSGYDLKKVFEESVNFFWSAQTSQIYRELKALEKAGCVVSWLEPGSAGPARRIYRITDLGIRRLREWLLDMPDETGEDNRNEFLLRVFLSSNVGGDELLRQLRRRLDKYRGDLRRLQTVQDGMAKHGDKFDIEREIPFWRISISRGFHDVESHIRWAEESIRYLEEQGFRADRHEAPAKGVPETDSAGRTAKTRPGAVPAQAIREAGSPGAEHGTRSGTSRSSDVVDRGIPSTRDPASESPSASTSPSGSPPGRRSKPFRVQASPPPDAGVKPLAKARRARADEAKPTGKRPRHH